MEDFENYIDKLNEQQRKAVLYDGGPSLVIAGAGSGKTRVLTYKIVHLLKGGMEPYRILALTFTNKAAKEMRDRIEQLVGTNIASKLWMGTFHSIFSRILRINAERIGFKSNFTIYDAADSKTLIKSIIKDMGIDEKIYKPSTIQNIISTAKNALMSPERYAADKDIADVDRRARRPLVPEIYKRYCNRCFVAGAMDFDDLLYYTNVLLRDNPDILSHYQEFFKFILVDEYQDTNFAQHLIISQLTERNHQLCVVGDDAQSIYSFRGANIRNILNLKNSYPDLVLFKLEQNYRSTQSIINAANSLIEKNTQQINKKVFSCNQKGCGIEVAKCYSDLEEAFVVVNRIRQLRRQTGNSYEEFAILYRTNAQSRTLEEQLRKANVPYRIYGGLSFYQRKEIKDAIAYFRMSINPDDDEALKRIINNPGRGIGETTVAKVQRAAIDSNVSMWQIMTDRLNYPDLVNSGTWNKLEGFVELISQFISANNSGNNAHEVARMIITNTGLLKQLITDSTPENITRRENLEELINGVNEFVENGLETGTDVSMTGYLSEISLATDQDETDGQDEAVTLMTVHAAKGLEFNNIFIVGVEDDLFPSSMSKDSLSQIEEERRLLYVAITRAKNFCMMSFAASRFRNGMTTATRPSPFLYDIDRHYLNFVSGTSLATKPSSVDPIRRYRDSYHSQTRTTSEPPASQASRISTPTRVPVTSINVKSTNNATVNGYTNHTADELSVGTIIEHSKFGRGNISSIDIESVDHRITVDFDTSDTRTLLLKFARFKIIEQ